MTETEVEDLHFFRRLQIGAPIQGDFFAWLHLAQMQATNFPLTLRPYRSGYFNPKTGGFQPVPPTP